MQVWLGCPKRGVWVLTNPKATFDHLLSKANSKKAKACVKISLTKPEGLYIWPLSGAASKLYYESLKVRFKAQ